MEYRQDVSRDVFVSVMGTKGFIQSEENCLAPAELGDEYEGCRFFLRKTEFTRDRPYRRVVRPLNYGNQRAGNGYRLELEIPDVVIVYPNGRQGICSVPERFREAVAQSCAVAV